MSEREELTGFGPFTPISNSNKTAISATSEREELANRFQAAIDLATDTSGILKIEDVRSAIAFLRQPPAPVQVTDEMVGAYINEIEKHPYDLPIRESVRKGLEAALQAGVPAQVTPTMVGNAIATYYATDGDWWKVCAEILSAAAPAPGEGR